MRPILSSSVVRREIVGVMGSHSDAYPERSEVVGRWIASQGYHLLTGAGWGVKGTVSRAYAEVGDRPGRVIGIVPSIEDSEDGIPLPEYPNPWVEIPIYTHLGVGKLAGDEFRSRNHINVLTSSAIILLPGGEGTSSEARLAVRYKKPCIGFLSSRSEIPMLPVDIPVEDDFLRIIAFLRKHLGLSARRTDVLPQSC